MKRKVGHAASGPGREGLCPPIAIPKLPPGQAVDEVEALKCAEKADPRVDLAWMRVRHERDLDIR